ncbi:LptF/LptG family permease [Pelagibacterales bacterium SAG-MED39]|nr:LptF/LptG family permease [Pelagibacterales bacterium SAG-MED39]
MITTYKKYIYLKYIFNILKVSSIFFVMIVVMNLFEEIKFLNDTDSDIFLPLFLTLLNGPSIFFEIAPFIFLISTIVFFIDLIETNEIVVYKTYGITNLKIIEIISTIAFVIGIFMIIIFYNVSSNLKFFYLEIKNQYAKDDKYLAVVTGNGLWIRDEINDNTNYINAEKLQNSDLLNISISQFDENFYLKKIIISKKANIQSKTWVLEDVIVSENNNTQKIDQLSLQSNFDIEKILTIFENFSSLNVVKLNELRKDYELLGYNTKTLDGYSHKLYSYPIYLTLMVCIASIIMLKIKYNKSKIFHITFGILVSVIIYYINHFFSVIIETQNVPYVFSIWGPQIILFMIITMNLVRINEK